MKYAGYMPNDFLNGKGVSVSLWVSGCPHCCPGCHNQEMWDYNYGEEIPPDIRYRLIKAIEENGITRNFSILGGEPLCEENVSFVENIVTAIHAAYPHILIFLWSGYTFEELTQMRKTNSSIDRILKTIDYLIDGRYEEDKRDISLWLRGSSNQNIIDCNPQRHIKEIQGE